MTKNHPKIPADLVADSSINELLALSPLDGRYRRHVVNLSTICSEFGLIRRRVSVEIEWLKFLAADLRLVGDTRLDSQQVSALHAVQTEFTISDAERVRAIEQETNHDVKAVEYFVKEKLEAIGLHALKEYVHFACTSEDINNLAYAMMLRDVRRDVLLPLMVEVTREILSLASSNLETPMLSRTHGQTASPTTLGKELVNVVARLTQWAERFNDVAIQAKINGAVGNFNAHVAAAPEIDWPTASATFVGTLGFTPNPYTTQIEPHDWIAEYLNALAGFNQVILDFDRDIWAYIALGYFKQKQVEGEVGSSTMPHKVNPIDFENSEGNVGIGNALAKHLADKLLISRWQRDLTDSTALRNVGSVFGHTVIALRSTSRGLKKLEVNQALLGKDLDAAWEVLSEAVQTVMRRHGLSDPYETVKEITRGKQLTEPLYAEMLGKLPLDEKLLSQLRAMHPSTYIGLAKELADKGVHELSARLKNL
ncbi:MAG: adenylosuccinate lyase [Gammaproteobacteria bacterium]|nr:adenylosuccinate lyase [Gammaproteobacteria bacterium]